MYSSSEAIVSEIRRREDPVREDAHRHNEYEIIYVEKGEIEITIDSVARRVRGRTLIFLTNLENHSIRRLSPEYVRWYVTLRTAPTDECIRNPDLLSVLKNHTGSFPNCVDVSSAAAEVEDVFRRLERADPDALFSNELIAAWISELLICAIRLAPCRIDPAPQALKERILNVQTYLDAHYAEDVRIDRLAARFYLSESYLSHSFRELTGYSPKQYLTTVRLKNASVLLANTNSSLRDVCAACGFSDVNNFSRKFRAVYRCSPGSLRGEKTDAQRGGA